MKTTRVHIGASTLNVRVVTEIQRGYGLVFAKTIWNKFESFHDTATSQNRKDNIDKCKYTDLCTLVKEENVFTPIPRLKHVPIPRKCHARVNNFCRIENRCPILTFCKKLQEDRAWWWLHCRSTRAKSVFNTSTAVPTQKTKRRRPSAYEPPSKPSHKPRQATHV